MEILKFIVSVLVVFFVLFSVANWLGFMRKPIAKANDYLNKFENSCEKYGEKIF